MTSMPFVKSTVLVENQLSKGNNGLVKTKYTVSLNRKQSLKVARPRLERIETDILNNFKVLGAQAHSLNGLERLIMYHVFNQDRIEPFKFQYKMLPETGLKTCKILLHRLPLTFQRIRHFDGKDAEV